MLHSIIPTSIFSIPTRVSLCYSLKSCSLEGVTGGLGLGRPGGEGKCKDIMFATFIPTFVSTCRG